MPSKTFRSSLANAEALGCLFEQLCLGSGRSLTDLRASNLDGKAAPGVALFRRQRRVALHHADARERNVELFGHHLCERGFHACAQIDFSGVEGNDSLGVDPKVGIHLSDRERLYGRRPLRERLSSPR